jgi:uncharacterized protein
MFINRETELAFLEQVYATPGAQLVILYGRRRIGKTALLRMFSQGKPAIYYMATRLPETQQLKELGEIIGSFFKDSFLAETGFKEWRQVFAYLGRRVEPFLFLIDEFPYLVEGNPAVSSLWQKGWDEQLAQTSIRTIITGSSISMMEQETLSQRAPLYGRRTGQLRLEPFSFRDARSFLQNYGFEDQVRAYAVFGGVPYYLSPLNSGRSLLENIKTTIFSRGAMLREEVEFLLREELQEPRTYFAIIQALAQGKRRPSEIANATGIAHGTLTKYLSVLQSLGLVNREVPATEKNPDKSKKGFYRVADPFVRFWFRFVLGQRALLEMERIPEAMRALEQELDGFTASVYEEICRDEVRRGLLDELTGQHWSRAGRWWDRQSEMDVLGFSDSGQKILFGECKWSSKPIGPDILVHLEETARRVLPADHKGDRNYVLFSRSGFSPTLRQHASRRSDLILVQGLTPLQ